MNEIRSALDELIIEASAIVGNFPPNVWISEHRRQLIRTSALERSIDRARRAVAAYNAGGGK